MYPHRRRELEVDGHRVHHFSDEKCPNNMTYQLPTIHPHSQTAKCWIHLFLIGLYCMLEIQPSVCKTRWSAKFLCDVMEPNISSVRFDCSARALEKVPKGITNNVTALDLSENSLKTIKADAFSGLLNLTWLNLNCANLKKKVIFKANLKSLTKLHELRLAGNGFDEIPNNLPESVEILELKNNNITFLRDRSFAGLPNLKQLWLSNNCYYWNPCGKYFNISENCFTHMSKLQDLDLSYNNLSHVPKGLPESLTMLNVSCNRIQHISKEELFGLNQLKLLKIQGNCPRCENAPFPCIPCPKRSLQIDPDAFENLSQLEELNMGGNSLEYLNPLWFKNLRKLKHLLLSFNFLLSEFTEKAEFLQYLPRLKVIDISFNYALKHYPKTINLSNEFSKLHSLRTLHMEGLVFQNIEPDTLKSLYGLKNLSALNLGTNFIICCNSTVFRKFNFLKVIYMAENRLSPTPNINPSSSENGYTQQADFSISSFIKLPPKDPVFELSHGLIKQQCFNSGRVLILSSNNLFFISQKQFEGYGDIACLNLSGNGFSAALNGTEFSLLPNLTYLDLSFNKINLAYDYAFQELKKLQVLDLSWNSHYFMAYGITKNLHFLKNLPVLRVLNMSHNSISTLTTKQMHSSSLAELQFTHNKLGTLWKEGENSYKTLFTNLKNLTVLDISWNNIKHIPLDVYEKLPRNLTELRISHNKMTDFLWDSLSYFPHLRILDLSHNSLSNIAGVKKATSFSLTVLDLTNNLIFHLGKSFFSGIKTLETLSLSSNKLNIINQSTFQPKPENLKTLFLQRNPFQCTCDSLDFIVWIGKREVNIPRLTTDVRCETPEKDRNQPLIYFNIDQCVNDDEAFRMYILTTFFLIVFMFVATVDHMFYWDATYVMHYIKAKLKGYRSLYSQENIYDVFVTYDTKDPCVSDWVMMNLRVKLEEEGEKLLPLCLEERDWLPGVPLVDNLTQSIRNSRKTVFVLTKGYVKTGVFKLALYLAHQRLLDENMDVIVLLMLEPVLQHSHFLRLRRRLCEKSVVEWPRTAAAEPWFWQNLRNVLRVDNRIIYNKAYTKVFSMK
ncbi:toll-like receptor 8 [Cyprinodon tularosa]|uniref:toll-like receptor 8 n=1 Tax=Cyprinodon tularosa TaxID=77115 RepID=UPI0018E1DEBD|nr:toll-like receptor 8 [Cyprinodon tularosa]